MEKKTKLFEKVIIWIELYLLVRKFKGFKLEVLENLHNKEIALDNAIKTGRRAGLCLLMHDEGELNQSDSHRVLYALYLTYLLKRKYKTRDDYGYYWDHIPNRYEGPFTPMEEWYSKRVELIRQLSKFIKKYA